MNGPRDRDSTGGLSLERDGFTLPICFSQVFVGIVCRGDWGFDLTQRCNPAAHRIDSLHESVAKLFSTILFLMRSKMSLYFRQNAFSYSWTVQIGFPFSSYATTFPNT
jgi:hypothetical protein